MSSVLSFAPKLNPHFDLGHRCVISRPTYYRRTHTFQCTGKNPLSSSTTTSRSSSSSSSTKQEDSESDNKNLFLKVAWYSSELLGIAASFLRKPSSNGENQEEGELELVGDGESTVMDRAQVVESIKEDFQRAYFVTGNLTLNAYEEECEFADPAGSFKGLRRFKRNCSNFGSLIEKSNMKLMKWEDFEVKGIGHWRFSCILSFPWKPILSATGYTEYYFDPQTGRVCRHVEHWNVPKMALFKQILRPSSQGWWGKKTSV